MPAPFTQFANLKIKENFFDRRKVQRSASEQKLRALSRIGAFVRSDARQSIRFRKNAKLASPVGSPPFAHEKDGKKDKSTGKRSNPARFKMIYFAYDPARDSVVVGPLGFRRPGGTTVPEAHEHGSTLLIRTNRGHRGGERKSYRWERVKYPARPFMRPALAKNMPRILKLWQTSWGSAA